MILQETVLVTLSPSNIQYFKSLGYEIPIYLDKKNRLLVKRNSQIEVQVSDLPKSSHVKVLCKCDECGKERKIPFYQYKPLCSICAHQTKEIKNKIALANSQRVISLKTRIKLSQNSWMRGKFGNQCPNFNPNLTEKQRKLNRYTSGDCFWIKSVKEKDQYTCQCCGYVGEPNDGIMCAHHLNNKNDFKEQRLVLENGITLCKECHKKIHKEYGTYTIKENWYSFRKNFYQQTN